MKKANRRSRQTSDVDTSSSQSLVLDDKEHYERRVQELESENKSLKSVIDELRYKLANVSSTPDAGFQKPKEVHPQNISALEKQVSDVKKMLEVQSQRTHKKDKAAAPNEDEIQRLKTQKVQLQCKLKLESVQFRLSKASLQKEILQLKKEQRRNKFEMHLLLAMNQRQKLILQRKTKEAHVATERLKELLGIRKDMASRKSGGRNSNGSQFQKFERELEVTTLVQEVCAEYEAQMEEMADVIAKLKLEAEKLKEESRCLLEDNIVDSTVNDSEFKDLKEELGKLNSLFSQMSVSKVKVNDKCQVDLVQSSSGSIGTGINLLDRGASESENSRSVIDAEEKSASGVCCSCSKNSLCKTSKCKCRASRGSCGTSCGCAASKCTNRVAVAIRLDDSLKSQKIEVRTNHSEVSETEMYNAPDKLHEREDFGPKKQPLRDVENIQINSVPQKQGRKKKGPKPVIQKENTNIPRKSARNVVQAT